MATEKQLRNAAKEFNKVMDGLDPLIDSNLTEEKLIPVLVEAIKWIDPQTDVFSKETQAVIDELSLESLVKEKKVKKDDGQQAIAEKLHNQNIAEKVIKSIQEDTEITEEVYKKETVKVPEKKEKLFSAKASTTADRIAFLTPLIEKGKSTKVELVEKAKVKFPDLAISSIQTMLTDAKNPKYNKFAKLVVQDRDGVMSFAK